MREQLTEAVRNLADARRDANEKAAAAKALKDAFDALNADVLNAAKAAAEKVAACELTVRTLAEADYAETGEKKPVAGVEIKQFKKIHYAEPEAFAWAKQTGLALVPEQLDKKSFEKIADATPLPFVTIEQQPRVTIASDLDKALAVADAAAPATTAGV